MQLIFESGKFIAEANFEDRMILKEAKFCWDTSNKVWWTDDVEKAKTLEKYASKSALEVIEKILKEKQIHQETNISASRATDSELDIPVPNELEYLPYQKAGIAYASVRPATLMADEMGLGKTIQAIGIANLDEKIQNVLIICPASLRINWKKEWLKWDTKSLTIGIASTKEFPDTEVVIANYEIVNKIRSLLDNRQWDLLICDESHYMKSGKAKRTQAVLGGKDLQAIEAKKRLFLTGTPITNRPAELWTSLHSLDPSTWRDWTSYVTRYCDGFRSKYGWVVTGASNLDELQEKLRSTIMVRRLKKDVLTELPSKRRQIVEIPPDGALRAIQAEQKIFAQHQLNIERFQLAVEIAKAEDEPSYDKAVAALLKGHRIALTEMSKARHMVALAKVPSVIEHVVTALESGKVVLFAHHKDVISKIMEHFKDQAVSYIGGMPFDQRQANMDRFQTDAECKLFVGSIQAAGLGITLTASSHVIFAELDWVPGNLTQAEDRCHRIGQKNSVLIQHLVLDGSVDATMAATLVEKQEVIDHALDEIHNNKKTMDTSDIKRDSKSSEVMATHSITTKKIDKVAPSITPEQITAIHHGLQILVSDEEINNVDTPIGKSLALSKTLTNRQAVLGLALIRRYRKQLPKDLIKIALNTNPA